MNHMCLRFGIQGIDDLISPMDRTNATIGDSSHVWTAAIQGPDGCGKSILALHLASRYWLDHAKADDPPSIIYVSTDLSYHQAQSQWEAFGLDQPQRRHDTLTAWYQIRKDREHLDLSPRESVAHLRQLDPVAEKSTGSVQTVTDFFDEQPGQSIWFVDLQGSTAGDDWGWVNQFISLLPERLPSDSKHLLVVDAVEGLETMVGKRDAYGISRSRRSRIAQLIRKGMRKGVHIVFVVEEPRQGTRLPENFVTDLVIRLRQRLDGDYSQRTIEVEKCRAVPHVRGEHELSIRTGKGAFTGDYAHLDNPQIAWNAASQSHRQEIKYAYLAHVHVTRSLHQQNREVREDRTRLPDLGGSPGFLLPQLDNFCFSHKRTDEGCLTLLLGDAGTHKGRLARRFLAGAFKFNSDNSLNMTESGIAILISTRIIDKDRLLKSFRTHWRDNGVSTVDEPWLCGRVFCQRLGSRHFASASLGEILAKYIHHAQQQLLNKTLLSDVEELSTERRRQHSHRIRIVIEDWSMLLASHRALRDDPMLLQSVITVLRREGVKSLLVSTQPAQPSIPITTTSGIRDLRALDETQVLTWPVHFFGQRRTAITVVSGTNYAQRPTIYELIPSADSTDDDGLTVDPHFDFYRDVDAGRPTRVPLVVRLYAGSHPIEREECQPLRFAQLLQDSLSQVFPSATQTQEVVEFDTFARYDRFFTFATELNNSRLDYTLILQVDEFWSEESLLNTSFAPLDDFWTTENVLRTDVKRPPASALANRVLYVRHSDTAEAFRKRKIPTSEFWRMREEESIGSYEADLDGNFTIEDRFVPVPQITSDPKRSYLRGTSRSNFFIRWRDSGRPVDRVPYLWDFGMLIADRELWRRHANETLPGYGEPSPVTVQTVWDSLCLQRSRITPGEVAWRVNWKSFGRPIDWPMFLAACRLIGERERIAPFDIDLSTAETLTCLVLEIWASLQDLLAKRSGSAHSGWTKWHGLVDPTQRWSLRDYAGAFPHTLYLALAHLIGTCVHLNSKHRVVTRHHVSSRAAASRQWYHTASAKMRETEPGSTTLLQLPGTWSTRGDWALAVASGSRSKLLAHMALDLLSSRRMNLLRLQDGLGLPVRDILPDSQIGELPSAIYTEDVDLRNVSAVSYGEICYLGANKDNDDFHWLWRSRIKHFERDSFYFRRWIARMFEERDWLRYDFHEGKSAVEAMEGFEVLESQLAGNRDAAAREFPDLSTLNKAGFGSQFCREYREKHKILIAALR